MFPLRLKVILSLTALALLVAAGGVVAQSSRAEPALTRSNSVLPPPRTPVLCRRRPSRAPFHSLGLLRLARVPGR